MRQNLFLASGFLCTFLCLPALYAGALLGANFDSFALFPLPCLACAMLGGFLIRKAESL